MSACAGQAANEVPDGEAEGLSEPERKERLLKLINSFGQPFATASKPQPLPTKRAKRGAKVYSLKSFYWIIQEKT